MSFRLVAPIVVGALLVSGCATPPVTPVREEVRLTIKSISADVSGGKHSDTSDLGARGAEEGASKGALQGASVGANSGSLLGILIGVPLGAAIGSSTGAANARSPAEVDEARANLRTAIQDTDFGEMLRSRLTSARTKGSVEILKVSSGSGTAAQTEGASHLLTFEYSLGFLRRGLVVPDVGVALIVKGQLLSSDRKQVLHTNTWGYCGELRNFIEMSQEKAAIFRVEMERAAATLSDAIWYDLFTNKESRSIARPPLCMNYIDVPSLSGRSVEPPAAAPLEARFVAQATLSLRIDGLATSR